MAKVILKKGRERSLLRRHPWIFSGAVELADEGVEAGEIVEVVSDGGAVMGYGAYSPLSQIRVRMLSFGHRSIEIDSLIRDRVFAAVARRCDFFVGGYTDAVRLINAESDLLPGVVVDFYAGWAVCQMTSAFASTTVNGVSIPCLQTSTSDGLLICQRKNALQRILLLL